MPQTFARWLREQMRQADLTYSGLAQLTGLSHTSIRGWALGASQPRHGSIAKLARALHVPAEQIYEQLGWVGPSDSELAPSVQQLVSRLQELTPEEVALVEVVVDHFLSRQSDEEADTDAED